MLKRTLSFGLSAFLVTGFLLLVTIKPAYAYIDLGSGSFILQMLLASIFASLFAIKVFWRKITGQVSDFFAKFKTAKVEEVD